MTLKYQKGQNGKIILFLGVFGVKESDEKVSFFIKGQIHPQRSPKGHAKVSSAYISALTPFFGLGTKVKPNSEDIFVISLISSL